jgi:predicted CXXCH cytochrome family protein
MRCQRESALPGWMKAAVGLAIVSFFLFAVAGCSPKQRYQTLSFFFDGVPNPDEKPRELPGRPGEGGGRPSAPKTYREHGPYGARMCHACHNRSTNALILPVQKLCVNCHNLQLNKKYIHGPVAAGGCKICHDPHGSSFPYLLVAEPRTFCFYCHNEKDVARNPAHEGVTEACTECHDAHMSDSRYLLK